MASRSFVRLVLFIFSICLEWVWELSYVRSVEKAGPDEIKMDMLQACIIMRGGDAHGGGEGIRIWRGSWRGGTR